MLTRLKLARLLLVIRTAAEPNGRQRGMIGTEAGRFPNGPRPNTGRRAPRELSATLCTDRHQRFAVVASCG